MPVVGTADVDRTGDVGINDFLTLLAAWGHGWGCVPGIWDQEVWDGRSSLPHVARNIPGYVEVEMPNREN